MQHRAVSGQLKKDTMEYVGLGTTGIQVSRLCLGTKFFGGETEEKTSHAIMDDALDQGFNFFDVAYHRNEGETERIVGRWLGSHRRDIVLALKIPSTENNRRKGEGLSRRNILFSVEESLRRLQTSYFDLLYLEHWDEDTAIEHTLSALNTLVEQGKVIHCGVSGFAAWQAMKAVAVARKHGYPPIVGMQFKYSLLNREAEVESFPLAEYEGLAVCADDILGAGSLGGNCLKSSKNQPGGSETRSRHAEVAERFVIRIKKQKRSPAALAAAWVMSHPLVTSTIVDAHNPAQFRDILQCLECRLTPDERAEITALSPDPPLPTDRGRNEVIKPSR